MKKIFKISLMIIPVFAIVMLSISTSLSGQMTLVHNIEAGTVRSCSPTVSGLEDETGLTDVTYCAICGPVLSKPKTLTSSCGTT